MARRLTALLTLSFCSVFPLAQPAVKMPPPCNDNPTYHKLDFWVGEWDVFDFKSGEKGGTNKIEKILKGCALIENWTEAADGSEGKSLFYFQPVKGEWRQVWVTDAGPMKEKVAQASYTGEGIRFQGEIPHREGSSHLDRTTLIPLPGDRVRQTIEVSRDAGKTWGVVFDAEYRRMK
jgi:hypothetical protein